MLSTPGREMPTRRPRGPVRLFQLDAFAHRRFSGNPAAVMPLDRFPDDAVLRALAAENNLSETAFLVSAGKEYRLRWFTPVTEVPLCGHATLASAAVVMERLEPGRKVVVFQSASGPLTVRKRGRRYVMDFPARPAKRAQVLPAVTKALGIAPTELWENEFNYMAVYEDPVQVRKLEPDFPAVARLGTPGVIVTAPGDGSFDFISRYFAPAKGINEDPVTGAAHCTLAPYWAGRLGKGELRAFQASRRGGEVVCRLAGDRVALEGEVVFYLEGDAWV